MEFELISGKPTEVVMLALAALEEVVFEHRSMDKERLQYEYSTKPNVTTFLAKNDEKIVGFKVGYEQRQTKYYSWIGGVHPDYRKNGIASELMKRQHEWAKEQGYKCILTKTGNEFRNMLLLNIRFGFDVIGTFLNNRNLVRIEMKKDL